MFKLKRCSVVIGASILAMVLVFCQGCASRFPVAEDQVMRITPVDPSLQAGEPSPYPLQITWHGTASYEIRLGELSLLLDPFVSHQGLFHSVLGGHIKPNSDKVRATFGGLDKPEGIFIAHAHWDHLMDVHEILKQNTWWDVPIFGSNTTKNLVLSYPGAKEKPLAFPPIQADGSWQKVIATPSGKVEYMAFESGHAPHVLGLRLYDGIVKKPRNTAPTKAHHFKLGKAYTFAFRLTWEETSFTVYFQSSASSWRDDALPTDLENVDVAILCVAGWNKVKKYPNGLIERLQPAHILLSHYDNFFQKNRIENKRPTVVPNARLQGFLKQAQKSARYPRWRQILVPDVGATLDFTKP